MKILCIVCAIVIVLIIGMGFYLSKFSITINRQSLSDALKWQMEHYDLSWYRPSYVPDEFKDKFNEENQNEQLMEEEKSYTIKSFDGYELHAYYLKNIKETNKYIIISHGHTDNHYGSLKYTKIYLELGFNVIIYDLRGHGSNEETICTYSVRERKDLDVIIKDTYERYGNVEYLGIHGESLGGATSIAVLENKPKIDFVVDDCGFADISEVFKGAIQGVPKFMVDVASACTKLRYGYSYKQMRPVECLTENTIPLCCIHGKDDGFILPEHASKFQNATKGYCEVNLIDGASHAASVLTDPVKYKKIVEEFLEKISK